MENLFASLPEDLESEAFDILVRSDHVTVERIVSRGHSSPAAGWYDQASNEWVLVLKGEAVIAFEEGEEAVLGPGDHIDIPAHRRHRVKWTAPGAETVWLAVHYRA